MLQGRACFPRQSHLRLDDQRAAQSPCLAILVPLGMWCLINNKRHRGSRGWPHPLPAFYRPRSRSAAPVTSRNTRYVAIHPLRSDTPVTSQCTRSEGVRCLQIGCSASHNKPNRGQSLTTDPNCPPRTQPHGFKMLARLRTRGAAPVTSRCTRSEGVQRLRIGCTASSTTSLHAGCLADTVHMLASNRPRPRSAAPDTAAMH